MEHEQAAGVFLSSASVANPESVQFSLDLPVKDSMVLAQGAQVKIFLDSDPLKPLDAVLTDASYRAQADKRDILSYTVRAELTDDTETLTRFLAARCWQRVSLKVWHCVSGVEPCMCCCEKC